MSIDEYSRHYDICPKRTRKEAIALTEARSPKRRAVKRKLLREEYRVMDMTDLEWAFREFAKKVGKDIWESDVWEYETAYGKGTFDVLSIDVNEDETLELYLPRNPKMRPHIELVSNGEPLLHIYFSLKDAYAFYW